jgi:hypothetical protein
MNKAEKTEIDFLAFFHRHLVPMVFVFKKDDITAPYVVTTFVLSVQELWFLVTAGHCLQEVDKRKKEGYLIQKCYLMDSLGEGAKHFEPIIFTYDLAKPQYMPDSREMDYGIIPLSTYYQGLLSTNNVTPLNEEVWRKQSINPEVFALIGTPDEFVQRDNDTVGVSTLLNWIDECEKPDHFPNTELPLFYGKVKLHSNQRSVLGMSGGPIFAFEQVNGNYRYWLKALQSSWREQSEIVIGCPTTFLGNVIDKMISENEKKANNDSGIL